MNTQSEQELRLSRSSCFAIGQIADQTNIPASIPAECFMRNEKKKYRKPVDRYTF